MTKKLMLTVLAGLMTTQGAFANKTLTVGEIEAQIQAASERAQISGLKQDITELRLKIQALEDIANPSVASVYRSYNATVSLTLASAGVAGIFIYGGAHFGEAVTKKETVVVLSILALGVYGLVSVGDQQKYNEIKELYEVYSDELQVTEYNKLTQSLQTKLTALDQALK